MFAAIVGRSVDAVLSGTVNIKNMKQSSVSRQIPPNTHCSGKTRSIAFFRRVNRQSKQFHQFCFVHLRRMDFWSTYLHTPREDSCSSRRRTPSTSRVHSRRIVYWSVPLTNNKWTGLSACTTSEIPLTTYPYAGVYPVDRSSDNISGGLVFLSTTTPLHAHLHRDDCYCTMPRSCKNFTLLSLSWHRADNLKKFILLFARI